MGRAGVLGTAPAPTAFLYCASAFAGSAGAITGNYQKDFQHDFVGLLVVYDDVDLPFGKLRARAAGSAGTHNGMKSIVQSLGTTAVPRP